MRQNRVPYHTYTWPLTFLSWYRNFNKKWEGQVWFRTQISPLRVKGFWQCTICPNCTSFHIIGFLGSDNFILYTITASRNYYTSYLPNITVLDFGKWNHSFIYYPMCSREWKNKNCGAFNKIQQHGIRWLKLNINTHKETNITFLTGIYPFDLGCLTGTCGTMNWLNW